MKKKLILILSLLATGLYIGFFTNSTPIWLGDMNWFWKETAMYASFLTSGSIILAMADKWWKKRKKFQKAHRAFCEDRGFRPRI